MALHQHNEKAQSRKLLELLQQGKRIALVSDAGTPGVSDPGALLVEAAHREGIRVEPLPGPSAALAAYSASGFASDGFLFAGFFSKKDMDALDIPRAVIVYEAPHRVLKTVQALLEHYEALGKAAATPEEMEIATKYLSDVFLVGVDTVAAIAGMTSDLAVLGLPNDYYDAYRSEVRAVTPERAFEVARPLFVRDRAVVVVAGDAERLAKPLTHFAPVEVIDPDKGFVTKSTLPHA